MGYNNDHYNYQVAVIFAILVGALLLLGLVLGGLYVCTKSMREEDKEKKRYISSRNSGQWPAQAPSYRPASSQMYQPPQQQQQSNQNFEFAPRSPMVAPSPISMNQTYNPDPYRQQPNPQYSQPPLVTPVSQDYINANRMQQVQPDVIYTQGPAGYIRSTPVEYTQTFHESTI
ncbi:unnamed protein product [Auanema sp. JU1783]|nr:unnamed protein product [Auanema sp. JU1783]